MIYARVFQPGNSQVISLAKEFRRRNKTVSRPRPANAANIFDALTAFPADLMAEGRDDAAPQERANI